MVAPELMRYLDTVRWPGTVKPLPQALASAVGSCAPEALGLCLLLRVVLSM